jgi:hypothetical protein
MRFVGVTSVRCVCCLISPPAKSAAELSFFLYIVRKRWNVYAWLARRHAQPVLPLVRHEPCGMMKCKGNKVRESCDVMCVCVCVGSTVPLHCTRFAGRNLKCAAKEANAPYPTTRTDDDVADAGPPEPPM